MKQKTLKRKDRAQTRSVGGDQLGGGVAEQKALRQMIGDQIIDIAAVIRKLGHIGFFKLGMIGQNKGNAGSVQHMAFYGSVGKRRGGIAIGRFDPVCSEKAFINMDLVEHLFRNGAAGTVHSGRQLSAGVDHPDGASGKKSH